MLAAAVVFGAPQLWGPREWGETDTGLIALLERQLDRIADGDPARRIRILATLATELYFDQAAFRGWRYANQALDEARRLGRPDEAAALAQAGLALETRVGSQMWINRTKDLIGRIIAGPGSPDRRSSP